MTHAANTSQPQGPLVGVLAVQGDFREHIHILGQLGARTRTVRRPQDLEGIDGLVIPGGESTAIDKLSRAFGLSEPIRALIREGLPVYGTCAGLIMLADEITDPTLDAQGQPQQTFGGIDMTVTRNAFGRQRESFEADLPMSVLGQGATVSAAFIRGPLVTRIGDGVEALATVTPEMAAPAGGSGTGMLGGTSGSNGRIVAVRSSNLLATSFHPEVSGETRLHELFLSMIPRS